MTDFWNDGFWAPGFWAANFWSNTGGDTITGLGSITSITEVLG